MCGLVGCAGRISAKEEKLFKQLLVLDTLRGEDSTGVARVGIQGEVDVIKTVGDPFVLFDTTAFELMMRDSHRVLIGHNRFATQGKVTRKNAHPFELDTLVGAHNGTLSNKWELTNGSKFDVDSQALYHDIEEHGLDKAMAKAKGAWALVWWDKVEQKLNFLRNKERPLHYVISEDKKVMFWASEAWMLTALLHRDGYKHGPLQEFKEDTHYQFDVELKSYVDMPELAKPRLRTVKGKKEVAVVQNNVGKFQGKVTNLPFSKTGSDYLGSKGKRFKAIKVSKDNCGSEYYELLDTEKPLEDVRLYINNRNGNLLGKAFTADVMSSGFVNGAIYYKVSPWSVALVVEVKDPNGNEITKEEFEKRYHTCAWCSSPVTYGEACHIFDAQTGILCKDCVVDAEVAKYVRM